MKLLQKPLLGLLLVAFGALFAGCVNNQQDSSIPWSRPADWEGQIPGMSSSGVQR